MTEHKAVSEMTAVPVRPAIEVPADIVATVVRRRAAGDLAADIGRDFDMTPLDVLDLIREVRRGERAAAPEIVELARRTVPGLARRSVPGLARRSVPGQVGVDSR